MFGTIDIGAVPAGLTRATGILKGIKDTYLKLDLEVTDKVDAFFIHEKVDLHDNSPVVNNAFDYKRKTIGFDYQDSPNTVIGVSYDRVAFDETGPDTLQDSGGWKRVRVDVRVKF